jgi:hypothetical protein
VTQFTCFTSTKVQILTSEELRALTAFSRSRLTVARSFVSMRSWSVSCQLPIV